MSSLMTCSGRDGRTVYGRIQVGDFICTSQIQLKYGSLMRSVTPGELMCYKKSEAYPHGPEFSTYICTNEIVAMLGIEPSRMDKKNLLKTNHSCHMSHDILTSLIGGISPPKGN